ncbi:IclR family transcriptional regulator domain-containing protein [Actinomadura rugatobispora]|uniref:IclR family transcriptional regulator C-terminal domain-containing protein n=1 Tax=Actinomadura rugatobispora TaxID=1994 RepID=A0ABW0ZWE4_9ACTN|nr:IclR family transcriptional regulator C-terminal domain-containing protein [Actinomadura rugatobispora]
MDDEATAGDKAAVRPAAASRRAPKAAKATTAARPAKAPEALESLERQLAVLAVFDAAHPSLTLSEVAALTNTTRPTARRILLTLKSLGYVRADGRQFSLTPKVLNFGWSFFASLNLEEAVQPVLNDLRTAIDESCSVGLLDGRDIVYIARAFTRRITTIRGRIGSRLPAHATAMGHALLAHLDDGELDAWLAEEPLQEYTERTLTDPAHLRRELMETRRQGWALVDGELETGLRAIAAPIAGADGRVVAAVSVSTISARTMISDLRKHVPALLETAEALSPVFRLNDD